MRKMATFLLALTAAVCLTTAALADVIAGPALVVYAAVRFWPWVLVALVVIITFVLLRKFRKKK